MSSNALRKHTAGTMDSGDYTTQRGTNGAAHTVNGNYVPLGYQQITSLSAAAGLTVPTGARIAMIVAEAQAVRFRDDGTNPTATVGVPLAVSTPFWYHGDLSKVKFIEQTASAKLNVLYY